MHGIDIRNIGGPVSAMPPEVQMSVNAMSLCVEVGREVGGKTELPSGMFRYDLKAPSSFWVMPRLKLDPSKIKPRSREEQIKFWDDFKASMDASDAKYHRHQLREVEMKLRGCKFVPAQVLNAIYRKAKKSLDKTGSYTMRDGRQLRTISKETIC
jgi:hypothetical protein